jgi:THO complex subunit 2
MKSQSDTSRPHSLPSRPEVVSNSSRSTNLRPGERPNERGPRDVRDSDYRRNERPHDTRDQELDRHPHRTYERGERPYDREKQDPNWANDKVAQSRLHDERHSGYPRDSRPLREERSDRNLRDRAHADSYDHRDDSHETRSRDSSKAGPRASMAPHPDRIANLKGTTESERNHGIHSDRRFDNSRSESQPYSSSRGSRNSSPTRRDERPPRSDYHGHRDERHSNDSRRHPDDVIPPRARHEDSRLPTGPRNDHHNDATSGGQDRPREAYRNPYGGQSDPINGRSQDLARPRQQESSYGRLNQDPPVGPRVINKNQSSVPHNTRNISQSQSQLDQRGSSNNLPNERPAPTGPASSRGPPGNSNSFNRPPPISTSVPPASAAESPDTAGVHPDRLKAIQGNTGGLDGSVHARGSQAPVEAPAGPRGPLGSQSGNNGAALNQSDRNRSDKRFAGINNVLSQASGPVSQERYNQGTSIKGRGRPNATSSPISNGPPRRDIPLSTDIAHQESFSARPPTSGSGPRDDESFNRRSMRSDERRPPHSRDARSTSPRRHPMSSASREDLRAPRMDEPRDHRGRGAPPPPPHGMPDRDRRQPRDSLPATKERDGRRESDRREDWGGQDRRDRPERRDSGIENGGSARKRPRVTEEVYDQAKPTYDHSKRPRRG